MSRAVRVGGPAALVLGVIGASLVGLWVGGGAAPLAVGDPGALVRYGEPVLVGLVLLSSAGALGGSSSPRSWSLLVGARGPPSMWRRRARG